MRVTNGCSDFSPNEERATNDTAKIMRGTISTGTKMRSNRCLRHLETHNREQAKPDCYVALTRLSYKACALAGFEPATYGLQGEVTDLYATVLMNYIHTKGDVNCLQPCSDFLDGLPRPAAHAGVQGNGRAMSFAMTAVSISSGITSPHQRQAQRRIGKAKRKHLRYPSPEILAKPKSTNEVPAGHLAALKNSRNQAPSSATPLQSARIAGVHRLDGCAHFRNPGSHK